MTSETESSLFSKSSRATLLHSFRKLQGTLDEWEGVTRKLAADGSHTEAIASSSGFFINAEERAKAAEALARGEYSEMPALWGWRDEIQKRLVHRGRNLAVELPAIYLTQKAAGHFTEQPKDEDKKVKWYNPVDVIGDFAGFTVKNLTTMLAPWEVGTAGASVGWRRLMTYGDMVSDNPTFNQHINNASVGLQTTLSAMGQSASDVLYKTTQRASRTAGAFSTAVKASTDSRTPMGVGLNKKAPFLSVERLSQAKQAFHSGGFAKGFEALAPDSHRFFSTFKHRWDEIGQHQANFEKLIGGAPDVDRSLLRKLLPEGQTDLEQFAQSIHRLREGGEFANIRRRHEYLKRLQGHLLGRSNEEGYADSVNEFIQHARVVLPSGQAVRDAGFNRADIARDRLHFGAEAIHDNWAEEMQRRLRDIMPSGHARTIVNSLPDSVHHADIPFLTTSTRKEMDERFQHEFEDFYHEAVGAFRDRSRQAKLPSSIVDPFWTQETKDLLIRRLANSLHINTNAVPIENLKLQLGHLGIDANDYHSMRGQLLDRNIVSKPWHPTGYNIFGLRPLSMDQALSAGIISARRGTLPNQVARDMNDPYLGGRSDFVAGRGLYQTAGGKIFDLRKAMGSLATFNSMMARHLRVPILGFSPYDLFGYESRQKMRMAPLLQVQSGIGKYFPGLEGSDTLFYLGGQRRGYGRLHGFTYGEPTRSSPDVVRPGSTRGDSIITRGIRRGLGETGITRKEPIDTSTSWGKFKNWLDISPDQPESLWNKGLRIWNSRAANRVKRRLGHDVKDDYGNPSNMAQWILDRGYEDDIGLDHHEGFDALKTHIEREYTYSPTVADRTADFAARYPRRLRSLQGLFDTTDPVTGETRPLSGVHDSEIMYRSAESMLEHDEQLMEEAIASGRINSDVRNDLRSAQSFIRRSFLRQEDVPGAMQEMSPRAMEATQIHRRLDEFRAALYSYAIQRTTLLHENGTQVINDLLLSLDRMKAQKLIRNAEYIEAKSAILGVQVKLSTARAHRSRMSEDNRLQQVLKDLMGEGTPGIRDALQNIATYKSRFRNSSSAWLKAPIFNKLGAATEPENFDQYNIYSPHQEYVYVPTTASVLRRNPVRGTASLLGLNNWSDPKAFSMGSIASGHLSDRLNRYFSMVNLGVDPSRYGGSASYFAKGMVGKRVLPAVAAYAALNTVDRTAGGAVHGKDPNGNRRYAPLVGGAVATGLAHAQVALTPGKENRQKKREELFGSRQVPVRRGRFWLMGSSSLWGGRVSYWRPSWYQRYMSGYKYGSEGWHSPIQQALYGYDFSPLRPLDPYKYEAQNYNSRPYPYTGQYFSGPWGPLTPLLNATVGRALKPAKTMHKQQLYAQLNQGIERVGHNGMVFNPPGRGTPPLVAVRNPTGSPGLYYTSSAGDILGAGGSRDSSASSVGGAGGGEEAAGGDGYTRAYRQPYGFRGMPYGTSPDEALASYRYGGAGGRGRGPAGGLARQQGAAINQGYVDRARYPLDRSQTFVGGANPYNRVVFGRPDNFDPRIMYAANPINPGSIKHQAGEFGYTTQEMAGIYGFGFGTFRDVFTAGTHDYHPEEPVYQSADRAYGSERSFWDLNLGGLGDVPLRGLSSEFDSIEASEIIRRFVPHRRREINEVNPIPNALGAKYPWLPGGADYFVDYTRGDPYSNIQEGELRLPGSGYERTHKLHPDSTGKYGILDQLNILSDVAPWSPQYKALNQAVSRMKPMMSPEDQAFLVDVHNRTSGEKKRHTFYPYKYGHADFRRANVQVTGFVPGEADQLVTSGGIIHLAGIRSRKSDGAEQWLHDNVSPGDKLKITYDANYPPKRDEPLDAIVEIGNKNLNQDLAEQQDISYPSTKTSPLDNYMRMGSLNFRLHAGAEDLEHMNTVFNNKFLPRRTPIEDWERSNVYGSSFPRWENPIQSYIKPLGYRAMNRNTVAATVALGAVGRMFGKRRESQKLGTILGAGLGAALSIFSNSQTFKTGERWLPQQYEQAGAIDEYTDILNYMRYASAYTQARATAIKKEKTDPEAIANELSSNDYKKAQFTNIGPATAAALTYRNKMRSTLYGADPFGDVMQLSAAVPRQQRDHFLEFMNAPVNERQRVLSVMPRMERRIFEARWGMKVEQRPDLVDYFSQHELPDGNWEGWNPGTDMEDMKLKIIQNQGLNASQLGYYPQQISEANALNYSYPNYNQAQSTHATMAQLNQFFSSQGINSSVQALHSNRPGTTVDLQMGVSS